MNTDRVPSAADRGSELTEGLGAALEEAAYDCMSELAGVDTHDVNLRDHPEAWAAVEAFAAKVQAAERERPREVIAYMATSRSGTRRFTDNPDAARELEGYGWAITPLADAGPNGQVQRLPAD